jgi:hypothetical protein
MYDPIEIRPVYNMRQRQLPPVPKPPPVLPEVGLFDVDQVPQVPLVEPVKTTLVDRQKAKIAAGLHPLSDVGAHPKRIPLAPVGTGTCGQCVHRRRPAHHGRAYPKCDAGAYTVTRPRVGEGTYEAEIWPRAAHSQTTDCRSWWNACVDYEAKGDVRG